MIRPPPKTTRTDTLCPSTTLFRSTLSTTAAVTPGLVRSVTLTEIVGTMTTIYIKVACMNHLSRARGSMFQAVTRSAQVKAMTITTRMRSEEHTSEHQSLMRISYAVFCLKKKNTIQTQQ